jgi:hypothetical protein
MGDAEPCQLTHTVPRSLDRGSYERSTFPEVLRSVFLPRKHRIACRNCQILKMSLRTSRHPSPGWPPQVHISGPCSPYCAYVYGSDDKIYSFFTAGTTLYLYNNSQKNGKVCTGNTGCTTWASLEELKCPVKDNCPLPVTSMNTATPPPGSVTKMIGPQCFVCMYTETGEPVEDYFAPNCF